MKLFLIGKIKSVHLILFFALFISPQLFGQSLWQESFETQGNSGTRYVVSTEFNDGVSDHFQRTDGSDISNSGGAYAGHDGNFYFAAEDTDDNGGDGIKYKSIAFNQINSSGWSGLVFSGMFAKGNTVGNVYDYIDGAVVSYSIDGGANYTQALKFRYDNGQNDEFNEEFSAPTNNRSRLYNDQ